MPLKVLVVFSPIHFDTKTTLTRSQELVAHLSYVSIIFADLGNVIDVIDR